MLKDEKTVIVGAGLAGLACGYELARQGSSFAIYETHESIGGLSKTMWFNTSEGRFGFDFGGHRFLTREKEIEQFFFDVIGHENVETRQRSSRILLKGKYFDYPVRPFSALLRMPIWLTIKAGFTYWYAFFRYFFARRKKVDNFEDWVRYRFGSTLYNLFFRDYTKKTWGIDPKNISSTWAAERIKAANIFSLIKNSLFRPDPESKIAMTLYKQFFYPSKGIQALSDNMAEFISSFNQEIFTNAKLTGIKVKNGKISRVSFENGDTIENFGTLVSSIPIPSLIAAMGDNIPESVQEAAKNLKYRDLILIGFMLDKPEALEDSWIYFPEDRHLFVRISEPTKYGLKMCPSGKTSIAAEITCTKGDDKWEMADEELIKKVRDQLIELGFFSTEEIIDSFVERTTHAYPLFDVDFEENLSTTLSFLSSFQNLELIGRTGAFQYINMDVVLLHGLNCAKKLVGITDKSVTTLGHEDKWVG